ncbi:MAG: TolC family protein [Acidobacteriota bacterium]
MSRAHPGARSTFVALALVTFARVVAAQTTSATNAGITAPSPAPLTVGAAVSLAVRQHPGPAEAAAAAAAAAEAVPLARAQYLPRLDAVWQVNRATRNNVFGLLLPQSVVPAISGPVLDDRSLSSVWGTAAGLLFSAEVFDFGRRSAGEAVARARVDTADAEADVVRLDAGERAADAFLTALGALRLVDASRANVTRLETLQRTVGALVDADLRPGADRSRVDAELASARNRLLVDEQALAVSRLRLAAATGNPEATPDLDAGPLLTRAPGGLAASAGAQSRALAAGAIDAPRSAGSGAPVPAATSGPDATHPDLRAAAGAAAAAAAALTQAERVYRPTILLQGALSARASGALVNGGIDNGEGLWPDVPNWAAGLTVTFPILDAPAAHARTRAQAAQVTAAQARRRAAEQRVRTAALEARIFADTATRMAENTPVQLTAARQSDAQARARYEAGLAGITDVADAQRVLAQADADAALATLALWRARLAIAAAAGDLSGFVAEAAAPTGAPIPARQER